jgi:hypothetical protein
MNDPQPATPRSEIAESESRDRDALEGIPKELLFEDFKQQITNLQNQYTRMHNRLQLTTGLNTALLPTLGTIGIAASRGDVGRGWLLLVPVAGFLLSAVGFLYGAADRRLVMIYRGQLSETARSLLQMTDENARYDTWLHVGRDPTWVGRATKALREQRKEPAEDDRWDRLFSWRSKNLSVTRLPPIIAVLFATLWLVVGVIIASTI